MTLVSIIITFHLAAVGITSAQTLHAYSTTPADKASWSYDDTLKGNAGVCSPTNKCGPSTWKNIVAVSPTVNQCGGQSQTPINLQSLDVVVDQTLYYPTLNVINGGCKNWVQFTDDHVFEFSVSDDNPCTNMQLTYAGTTYTMLQGHTHSPSEHTFGGGFYDGELHLVHKSSDGKLLVLAIMFEADDGIVGSGSTQSSLSVMWNAAINAYKAAANSATVTGSVATTYEWPVTVTSTMDFYRGFLPPSRAYWTYTGSLTTYPCTEGVTFLVFEQPVHISTSDLNIIRNAVAGNKNQILTPSGNDNRPINPLNGRTIKRYTGIDPSSPTMTPTMVPTMVPSATFTTDLNVVASAVANNAVAVQSALAALFPGIQVSNPVVTSSATTVSAVQNIPAGVTLQQATTTTFMNAFQTAVASSAGVASSSVVLGTPTAGRRLLAGINQPFTIGGLRIPSGSGTSTGTNVNANGCFADSEVVTLENGTSKSIAEVQIGDRILSADVEGKTSFSDVVYVPHGANTIEATFVILTTESGRNVKMTTNHILPAGQCDGAMTVRRADAVSTGDCVMTVDGAEKVMDMVTMQGKGIYTVVTNKDFIVVNSIIATPFGGINPTLANIYYNLHRLVYAFMPQSLMSYQNVMQQAMDQIASIVL